MGVDMFTDIHHHIIYGVDDGPKTLEQAQKMLRRAAQQGVHAVICTSHAMPAEERFPLETYMRHLEEEQRWCEEEGLDLRLYPGCEILWDSSAARLLSERAFPSLNGQRYALVEFYPSAPWTDLKHAALSLGIAGYQPVFAHVERFQCLRKAGRLQELADGYGVILQMNAGTVLSSAHPGLFGDRWPGKVLEAELIDVVATDAHDTEHRPCRMKECYEFLRQRYDEEFAARLCIETPSAILKGERL